MKVGFLNTCLNWVPHFETDLELIDKHLEKGDEVFWFDCNSQLSFCQPNPNHKKSICQECIKRKNRGLALLEKKVTRVPLSEIKTDFKPLNFGSITEYKNYTYKEFDAGLASVSSVVSALRDPNPEISKYRPMLERAIESSVAVYDQMIQVLENEKIDRVYVFNGRFAIERAIFRACQMLKVDCYIHERGKNIYHYMLYENSLPHNRAGFRERMEEAWDNNSVNEKDKREVANRFYHERRSGKEQFWVSFVSDQKKGLLPENWNNETINITIFTSSEDEMVSISDEWKNPVYPSQLEGIERILNDAPRDFHFYLRIHPNLVGVKNNDIKALKALNAPNLTIIHPNSKVSTYSLMDHSHKIISFGSTVGIEAAYWGTPSILAGMSYYRGLGATYDANCHQDVLDFILADLQTLDKEAALKYGYYMKDFGYPYLNYKPTNLYLGRYKGKLVYGNKIKFTILSLLAKLNVFSRFKRITKKYRRFLDPI